jgi:predicted dehydrogenase
MPPHWSARRDFCAGRRRKDSEMERTDMSDNLFRWGILSTAKIGRDQVLPAIARSENCTIQAIASRDGDKARDLARRFGAHSWHDSYEALLADPEIDGVYIPLPSSQHAEWAIRGARAGKHVLCEKPIAMRAGDIDRIIVARDAGGVVISEAFMVWYHPQWHKVRDLIAAGRIGRLQHVTGGFSYFNTDPANMRNQPALGGGGLPDIGVYPLVTTLIATGATPGEVQAQVKYSDEFGTDIYAQAVIDFGAFNLSFHCATQMALHQSMRFFGDTGWIDVSAPFNADSYGFAKVALHDQRNQTRQVFRFADSHQYLLQVDAFARACAGERDAVMPLEMSLQVQGVIDAIYAAGGQRPTA